MKTPLPILPEGYPPVIEVSVDRENVRHGRRIFWFQDTSCLKPLEMRYVKVRGRDALPPIDFFGNPDYTVVAIETAATWEKSLGAGWYLRRAVVYPTVSPLISFSGFQLGKDEAEAYLFKPPADHIAARELRKKLASE